MKKTVWKYKIGFDVRALILFLAVMIPNCIWFAVPAPNDVLRNESITPALEMLASVCQVVMIAALCCIENRDRPEIKLSAPSIVITIVCCALYFTAWFFYYRGETHPVIILGLTVPPCLAFLFYSLNRKNYIAVIPAVIFTVCHLLYGIVNFIV